MYDVVMLRVSEETRDLLLKLSREEFDGASADETVRRLLDEHWEATQIAIMDAYRANDPDGWTEYLREADEWDAASAPPADEWDSPVEGRS